MITALFTILLLIDRQTGSMFQGALIFILPIPMVAYGARYGLRSSFAVWIASTLMAVFFSLPTTLIYSSCMAFIGMILGSRIHDKKDMTRTLLLVMLLSIITELVNVILLAVISGTTLDQDVLEMQTIMTQALESAQKIAGAGATAQGAAQMDVFQQMLTPDFLKRILIVSVAFTGAVWKDFHDHGSPSVFSNSGFSAAMNVPISLSRLARAVSTSTASTARL